MFAGSLPDTRFDAAERPLKLRVRARATSFADLGATLFRLYPRRATLGLVLMAAQAFCYNAIFFTYALMLTRFYDIPEQHVGYYIFPFAIVCPLHI